MNPLILLSLKHIGLGLLGMLIYTLWKAKDYILQKDFVFVTMMRENLKTWIWSIAVIITLAVSITIEPSIKESIKSLFSIDLDASPAGFFLLGATLNLLIKPNQKFKKSNFRVKKINDTL